MLRSGIWLVLELLLVEVLCSRQYSLDITQFALYYGFHTPDTSGTQVSREDPLSAVDFSVHDRHYTKFYC